MYNTIEDIQALLGVEAETISLEFKAGEKLNSKNDNWRVDFIKEVTAFANAGGGTVIYGVGEKRVDAKSYASIILPVTDPKITQDRLREIIASNTDPVLRSFSIESIPTKGGFIFVVIVAEGDTAYQNKLDRLYYGRIDASAQPMYGFAVRDVMNRRTRPHVTASFKTLKRLASNGGGKSEYLLASILSNEGSLTAHNWALRVALPNVIGQFVGGLSVHLILQRTEQLEAASHHQWYRYSSVRPDGLPLRILPGEQLDLSATMAGGAQLVLRVESPEQRKLIELKPSVYWELFVDDAPKQKGAISFAEWFHSEPD